METETENNHTKTFVPEEKPNAELEYISYLTGIKIEEVLNADLAIKRRISAYLVFIMDTSTK